MTRHDRPEEDSLRLYGMSFCPFAAKVRKCLELKGIAFEAVDVPLLDRRALVRVTGGGIQMPVLEDGGEVVSGSARITSYLDERYAPSLRADPLAVVVEGWADGPLDDVILRLATPGLEARMAELNGGREDAAGMFRFLKERRYGAGCVDGWKKEAESLSARAAELLAPLGRILAGSPFLLGAAPSLADAAVFGQLHMLEMSEPTWIGAHVPAVRAWWERMAHAGARAEAPHPTTARDAASEER